MRAAGHAGPLRQIDDLGEHVAGVGPLAAQRGGVRVETLDDEPPPLVLRDDDLLLGQVALVVTGGVDDDGRAEDAVPLRDVAHGEPVERAFDGLVAEHDHEPADGPREAQVLVLAGGPAPPAHAAGDLQAGDEPGEQARQHVGGGGAGRLHAHHGELGAVHHLAAHVFGLGAARAREPQPGLGQLAGGVVGHLRLGPAKVVGAGYLELGHVLHEHGDAAWRHEHPRRRGAGLAEALLVQQPAHQAGRLAVALELAHQRLAHLVRQLFAADLDQQGAQVPPPWPVTSRYWPATLRARSRTRAMCMVRSVTLMTPRASSMLKAWLHLSTWS